MVNEYIQKLAEERYPIQGRQVCRQAQQLAFIAGFSACREMEGKWEDVEDQQPEIGQKVAFVVKSTDEYYNGQVYGGTYQGYKLGYYQFSVPGIGFVGSHWQPLPTFSLPPKPNDHE